MYLHPSSVLLETKAEYGPTPLIVAAATDTSKFVNCGKSIKNHFKWKWLSWLTFGHKKNLCSIVYFRESIKSATDIQKIINDDTITVQI